MPPSLSNPKETTTRPKRWIDPPLPADPGLRVHPHPLVNQILVGRGIETEEEAAKLLDPQARPAPEPNLLPGMDMATARILGAIDADETIAIFGDYDADGVTSTAILVRGLRTLMPSHRVIARLPHRDEGYGLNRDAVDEFVAAGATLLVTVDCGSTDHVVVPHAIERGLEVIVLDHHHMEDDGPAGALVISAHRPGADGTYHDLTGAGLAYLLICALLREGRPVDIPLMDDDRGLLDLVAIGQVADMAPMKGTSRALVRDGIRQLRDSHRVGIVSLCRAAATDQRSLTSMDVAFRLGPRINAAGRMGDPRVALDLLLTDDPVEASNLAAEVDALNHQRRGVTDAIVREATEAVASDPIHGERGVLVLEGEGWRAGVLGIAASNLVEEFGQPVILLAANGDVAVGSARSVPGFDIIAALHRSADLMERFGGHSQAAGMTVRRDRIPALRDALHEAIVQAGVELPVQAAIQVDAAVHPGLLDLDAARQIALLEPFGPGNEEPRLRVHGITLASVDTVGADRKHLRFGFTTERGQVKGIAFGQGHRLAEVQGARRLDVVGRLSIDTWNGQQRLSLQLDDFRVAGD